MNPNIERLKLIFVAIFAVAVVGVVATATALRYTLFAGVDPTHRAIARVQDADDVVGLVLVKRQARVRRAHRRWRERLHREGPVILVAA